MVFWTASSSQFNATMAWKLRDAAAEADADSEMDMLMAQRITLQPRTSELWMLRSHVSAYCGMQSAGYPPWARVRY